MLEPRSGGQRLPNRSRFEARRKEPRLIARSMRFARSPAALARIAASAEETDCLRPESGLCALSPPPNCFVGMEQRNPIVRAMKMTAPENIRPERRFQKSRRPRAAGLQAVSNSPMLADREPSRGVPGQVLKERPGKEVISSAAARAGEVIRPLVRSCMNCEAAGHAAGLRMRRGNRSRFAFGSAQLQTLIHLLP